LAQVGGKAVFASAVRFAPHLRQAAPDQFRYFLFYFILFFHCGKAAKKIPPPFFAAKRQYI
ncbi:MAG: hypothetical protein FWF53_11710, partial [Candidatus Azobacteroides sp.]|nr:hypothetical protein [Candidatus Azobacteroides sp.]